MLPTKILVVSKIMFWYLNFNNESHSYATTENIIQSLNNMILGCATETCANALASKGLPTNGAVGAASGLIASLYATPPASSAYYLADLGQRLNLTQPVYAQGIGFSGLNPLLPLWKAAQRGLHFYFCLLNYRLCHYVSGQN